MIPPSQAFGVEQPSPVIERTPRAAMLCYAIGEIPITVTMVLVGIFALFFYSSVVGLPGALVGVGLSTGLVVDALLDPYIGFRSDRGRHPFGKRHSFMLAGAVAMGPCFFLLFHPPDGWGTTRLFLWLLGSSILFRTVAAVYRIPYLTLGAEMSSDYDERTRIIAVRALFGLLGTLMAAGLSFVVFFPERADGSDPKLQRSSYPAMAAFFGLLMSVCGLVAVWGTQRFREVGESDTARSLREFWRSFPVVFRNRSFRLLWASATLFFLAVVMNASLGVHYFTWYVKITDSKSLSAIQAGFYGGAIAGVFLWMRLAKKAEKKTLYILGMAGTAVILVLASLLVGEGTVFGTGNTRIVISGHFLAGVFASSLWVIPASMMADVADEDRLATGEKREGIFFGILNFGEKVAAGMAILLSGLLLSYFVRLQSGAQVQSPQAAERIGLIFGLIPGLLSIGAVSIMASYSLSRKAQALIQDQLRNKAAGLGGMLLLFTALSLSALPASAQRSWEASWIWDRPPSGETNVYTHFRKSISLPAPAERARAFITADSRYQLFVNGTFIGRGPARAAARQLYYDVYDVTPHLRAGLNVVAVLVHHYGIGTEFYEIGHPGLLFELEMTRLGSTTTLGSDGTWKTMRSAAWDARSPRENDSNGFLEVLDFRQEPTGWREQTFDDSSWPVAYVAGTPANAGFSTLLQRDIPALTEIPVRPVAVLNAAEVVRAVQPNPLEIAQQVQAEPIVPRSTVNFSNLSFLVTQTGPAATVSTPQSGRDATIILDFGRVLSGMPFLDVEGPDGATVDITFSEWIKDGNVPAVRAPIRFLTYTGLPMNTSDRIVLRSGRQRWQRFHFTGFRFLQLTIRNAPTSVTLHSVGAIFHSYPFTLKGNFRSSDELLNRIWATGVYTVQISTSDTFTDCPWREKGQWMDMVTPLVSHYAFGDRAVTARYLRTSIQSLDAEGRHYLPYPSAVSFELPDQTMWWAAHLWLYYLHFGDVSLLDELYPQLRRIATFFRSQRSERGLLNVNWPFTGSRLLWPWIDHGHRTPNIPGYKLGEIGALDAMFYKFLVDAANIARATGHTADADQWDSDAELAKQAFQTAYWDDAISYYWDNPQRTIRGDHASVLAVLFGIAPRDRATAILKAALDENFRMGYTSPHFYYFILEALNRAGMQDVALAAIRRLWGDMLAFGATSWWEHFQQGRDLFGIRWRPGENHNLSLAHGYSSAPSLFLQSTSLGIRPAWPGFAKFSVAPTPAGLQWAEGSVPTPWGLIQVSWAREAGGAFRLTGKVPPGTVGVFSLPLGTAQELLAGGTVIWRRRQAIGTQPGVRVLGESSDRVHVEATGGTYQFISR